MKKRILIPTALSATVATITPLVCSCSNRFTISGNEIIDGPYKPHTDIKPLEYYQTRDLMVKSYLKDLNNDPGNFGDDIICSTLEIGGEQQKTVDAMKATLVNVDLEHKELTYSFEIQNLDASYSKQMYSIYNVEATNIIQGVDFVFASEDDTYIGGFEPIFEPAYLLLDDVQDQKEAGANDMRGSIKATRTQYLTSGVTETYEYNASKISGMSDAEGEIFNLGLNMLRIRSTTYGAATLQEPK